jgi:hypothetical protein
VAAADCGGVDVDAWGIFCQFVGGCDLAGGLLFLRSDVVHDDGNAQAVLAAEDVLQEGCLSGSLESVSDTYRCTSVTHTDLDIPKSPKAGSPGES